MAVELGVLHGDALDRDARRMTEPAEKPAPSRDEILQSHFDRLHSDLEALPGRIVGRMVGVALAAVVIAWVVWSMFAP